MSKKTELLYIIRHRNFKIGVTRNLKSRMATIQTGNEYPLRECVTIACRSRDHSKALEDALHEKLSRWRMEGEWFRNCLLLRLRLWWATFRMRKTVVPVVDGEVQI